MRTDSIRRLPLYSLAAGAILATVLMAFALSGTPIPSIGLGAMGLLPLAAALVDATRMRRKQLRDRAGEGSSDLEKGSRSDHEDLQEWLEEKAESLTTREQGLNTRALALQQWMQFPDAIDFTADVDPGRSAGNRSSDAASLSTDDPMARHDRELQELIEAKTRELFDSIKMDAYRKDAGDRKVFDNEKIRVDLIALVADVADIYRPGERSPLLKTNVEAVSRAAGRASLRLLVAVENLPGGLASYDFQSIYNLVIRAVKTFGMYKSAKPYLDIASGMLFAGRIVSSTNPITLVAWWAASKATTYGASKLGEHVLDQQAVGLIRQLVEIVAVEVASIYSPMVRYRDIHWIYGVELVHLASELSISDAARVQAMKQLSLLNLRDEYGRVSLMRHLANGSTSRPANYRPSESLSAADRMIVAQRLETFLLTFVMNDSSNKANKTAISEWQSATADRLDIQFRDHGDELSDAEQSERAAWALASFALHHLGDAPDDLPERLKTTQTWAKADASTQDDWAKKLVSDPPFLYHAPIIAPDSAVSKQFLDDLVLVAASGRQSSLINELAVPQKEGSEAAMATTQLLPWLGEDSLRATAYFLRAEADTLIEQFRKCDAERVLRDSNEKHASHEVIRVLDFLKASKRGSPSVGCLYPDGTLDSTGKAVHVTMLGSEIVCFDINREKSGVVTLSIISESERQSLNIEKISGYVRSDCQLTFSDQTTVTLPGSTLRSYDSYFAALLKQE